MLIIAMEKLFANWVYIMSLGNSKTIKILMENQNVQTWEISKLILLHTFLGNNVILKKTSSSVV